MFLQTTSLLLVYVSIMLYQFTCFFLCFPNGKPTIWEIQVFFFSGRALGKSKTHYVYIYIYMHIQTILFRDIVTLQ